MLALPYNNWYFLYTHPVDMSPRRAEVSCMIEGKEVSGVGQGLCFATTWSPPSIAFCIPARWRVDYNLKQKNGREVTMFQVLMPMWPLLYGNTEVAMTDRIGRALLRPALVAPTAAESTRSRTACVLHLSDGSVWRGDCGPHAMVRIGCCVTSGQPYVDIDLSIVEAGRVIQVTVRHYLGRPVRE